MKYKELQSMASAGRDDDIPNVDTCKKVAEQLHAGVKYGQSTMIDQVLGTAELVARYSEMTGNWKKVAVCAALLHKCQEEKRLGKRYNDVPFQALLNEDIMAIAGMQVMKVVELLHTEPQEDKTQPAAKEWQKQADWAVSLFDNAKKAWQQKNGVSEMSLDEAKTTDEDMLVARAAQEILMAEKLQNFYTSRDKPNVKWPPKRHRDYYETRWILMGALKDVNSAIYAEAEQVKNAGLQKVAQRGCADYWEAIKADYRAHKRCA